MRGIRWLSAVAHSFLADPHRKPAAVIAWEAAQFALRHREVPTTYFGAFAFRKGAGCYRDYISYHELLALQGWLGRSEHASLLGNKLVSHSYFRGAGLPLARLLAHNTQGTLNIIDESDDTVDISSASVFASALERVRARSRSGEIFVKPVDGQSGGGVGRFITCSDAFWRRVTSASFIFEEALTQHPTLAAIYPHAVNTVRVLTCGSLDGDPPVVVAALLRMGAGGSDVDNASRGGLFVGIDLATGRLLRRASRFLSFGGGAFTEHPDTGCRFEGLELPHFGAVLNTAKRAAAVVQHPLVGWDVAIAEDGPVLVEGNERPHLGLVESTWARGLLADATFRKLCTDLGIGRFARKRAYGGARHRPFRFRARSR